MSCKDKKQRQLYKFTTININFNPIALVFSLFLFKLLMFFIKHLLRAEITVYSEYLEKIS